MYFALREFHIGHLPLVLLFLKLDSHRTPEFLLVTQLPLSNAKVKKRLDFLNQTSVIDLTFSIDMEIHIGKNTKEKKYKNSNKVFFQLEQIEIDVAKKKK